MICNKIKYWAENNFYGIHQLLCQRADGSGIKRPSGLSGQNYSNSVQIVEELLA